VAALPRVAREPVEGVPVRPLVSRGAGIAYSALLRLAAPIYLARLWWRGRAEPLYRAAIGERFGRYDDAASTGWLWIHAVSLGETRAAGALIDALRVRRPQLRLLLTHGTATGREAGRTLLREGDRQTWLPYDAPAAVRRFLEHFRPAVGVLMETEVWPNLLAAARTLGVPMVLANARLSEKSARRGRRFEALMRPAAHSIALVLAQSDADATRLRAAGGRDVLVSGNLKFDMTPNTAQRERGAVWREALGRPVVLGAVTREGEEEALIAAWIEHPAPRPLLLVVPRHPQRFDEVASLLRAARLTFLRRSAWADTVPADARAVDAWLGDSMGEMALYYGLAQVALLGGSFAPLGGQNLIEAAACGCPVVMGRHTFNFAQAAELSVAAGAALRVPDIGTGVREALGLLDSPRQCEMTAAALRFAAQHRGAAGRMADRIAALLDASGAGGGAGAIRPATPAA
jgi:3-deoxy-D-manno-octulosonic-acid transferase